MKAIAPREIAHFELLVGLAKEELATVCSHLGERRFAEGDVIFHEGDPSGEIFFLLTGEVEISQALTLLMSKQATKYDTREKSIIRLSGENGAVFGEVSIFTEDDKRTATVKALTDCRMGSLQNKDFFEIMVNNQQIGYKVLLNLTRVVCNRLVAANRNVLKLTTALSLILEK